MTPDILTDEQHEAIRKAAEIIAQKYTRNASDKDDFEQMIYLDIYSKLNSFDSSRGRFEYWCFMVAESTIKTHLTSCNASSRIVNRFALRLDEPSEDELTLKDLIADPSATVDPFDNETIRPMLSDIFDNLSKIERLAFALCSCARIDYEEAAEVINDAKISSRPVTGKVVDNALTRARAKLRERMQFRG